MQIKKIGIVDLVVVLLERKRFLIISMIIISAASLITSYVIPKYYTATASLLPSTDKPLSNPLSSLFSDIPLNNMVKSLNFLEGTDNNQLLAILGSRRLAEKIIKKFDLVKRYKFDKKRKYYIEDVIRKLYENCSVTETDLNVILISFTDTNPVFSANVVNYIVSELDSLNSQISRDKARNSRIFFENRLSVVKRDMDSANKKLADFQEEHNCLDLNQQVASSVGALSNIEAQIMNNDIKVEFLKSKYGENSYEVKELLNNRHVLERRMKHYFDNGSGELIIPLKNTPRLGIEYSYLFRDVTVQAILYNFLLQNYEEARLSEANNTPTVNVLDYAKIPEKKSRPKRAIICILITSGGFILISIILFIMKWYDIQRQNNSNAYKKINTLILLIKKW